MLSTILMCFERHTCALCGERSFNIDGWHLHEVCNAEGVVYEQQLTCAGCRESRIRIKKQRGGVTLWKYKPKEQRA